MSKRKLTDDEVRQIRCLDKIRHHHIGMANTYSLKNIAAKYGVSPTTVHGIVYGYSYANVSDEVCKEDFGE